MDIDIEKLEYLLDFTVYDTEQLIYEVLGNSKEDPHYSAVTANNRLICYIDIMKSLKKELPYSDMKSFFEYNQFTEDDYLNFKKQYDEEKEIYVGKIY